MRLRLNAYFQTLLGLLLVGLVLGQLQRIQLTPSVALYLHDLVISFLVFCALIHWLIKSRKIVFSAVSWWGSLFLVSIILSWLINLSYWGVSSSMIGGLYLLRLVMFFLLFPSLNYLFKHQLVTLSIDKTLASLTLVGVFIGLLQYVFLPDTRFLHSFGWDEHLNRLIGFYFDPGFTGLLFLLGLIVLLTGQAKKWALVVTTVALTLTLSRASILAAAVVILYWSVLKSRVKPLVGFVLVVSLTLLLLPYRGGEGTNLNRTYSISSRVESTEDAIEMLKTSWLFGIGFNNYRLLETTETTHLPNHVGSPDNSYVFIWTTAGLFGLISFTGLLLRWFWWSRRNQARALELSLVAVSVHSLFNNSWFYPFVLIWMAVLYAASQKKLRSWGVSYG